ncbi:MAG: transposase [Caldilineaceae bacterium]
MTTVDFITELFCVVAEQLDQHDKHSQAKLYPSEVVTIALLYALKGSGSRAFWRWLTRDYRALFPQLPSRTRLFRLFVSHRALVSEFMAEPSLIGVIDSYGIELLHPVREGRSEQQIGRKGKSNHRWIVGGKLCYVLNHLGLIVSWDCDTANVYDGSSFQQLVDDLADWMVVFSDTGFEKTIGIPPTCAFASAACGTFVWSSKPCFPCSPMSVISSIPDTKSGSTLKPSSLSPWLYSTFWCNGMAFNPMKLALCPFPSLSLVCDQLAPKVNILFAFTYFPLVPSFIFAA